VRRFVIKAFWLASLGLATQARAGTLWVDWPEAPEPCGYDEVAVALRARLPGQDVQSGRHVVEAGHAQLAFSLANGDWLLELRAPDNPELRRNLPSPAVGDCLAFAERASLVVDRYLQDIHWTGAPVVVDRLERPTLPIPPAPWHGVVELGVGGGPSDVQLIAGTAFRWLGVGVPAAQLDVGFRRGPWLAELGALGELPTEVSGGALTDGTAATLHLQGALGRLSFGRLFGLGPGALRAELVPGAQVFKAWSSGSEFLKHRQTTLAVDPFVGARVGYQYPLGARFFVSLRLEARVLLIRDEFEVPGLDVLHARTSPVSGEGTLCLGYLFF
jgi:hypothetical protein